MEVEKNITKKHSLTINYGENFEVKGIVCVLEYDENQIVFKLQDNVLTIKGKGLDIASLDVEGGNAKVNGSVFGLEYSKNKEKQSVLKRIFK